MHYWSQTCNWVYSYITHTHTTNYTQRITNVTTSKLKDYT